MVVPLMCRGCRRRGHFGTSRRFWGLRPDGRRRRDHVFRAPLEAQLLGHGGPKAARSCFSRRRRPGFRVTGRSAFPGRRPQAPAGSRRVVFRPADQCSAGSRWTDPASPGTACGRRTRADADGRGPEGRWSPLRKPRLRPSRANPDMGRDRSGGAAQVAPSSTVARDHRFVSGGDHRFTSGMVDQRHGGGKPHADV